MAATLIVSVAGLNAGDAGTDVCARFAAELDARGVPVSWLLPARPGGRSGSPRDADWLRRRTEFGDALVLQGFDPSVAGRRGEFAALPRHEATLRLIAASRALDALGLVTDAFAPPRWAASAGTLLALRELGFRVCADRSGVHLLDTGTRLRGRVLTAGQFALTPATAKALRKGELVRVTLDAARLRHPDSQGEALDAVDAATRAGALPATYRCPVPARSAAALSA